MTGTSGAAAGVTVIGEAIIDLVPGGQPRTFQAVPGGSPYNVAIGLARLGHRTTLMARLADTAQPGEPRGQLPQAAPSCGSTPGLAGSASARRRSRVRRPR